MGTIISVDEVCVRVCVCGPQIVVSIEQRTSREAFFGPRERRLRRETVVPEMFRRAGSGSLFEHGSAIAHTRPHVLERKLGHVACCCFTERRRRRHHRRLDTASATAATLFAALAHGFNPQNIK